MKNAIKEFIEPTIAEKRVLWANAVFVFDTNVLLNLYRYSAKTRKTLLEAFDSVSDRVWLPHQVAYEFMKRRCEVIFESVYRYDQFKKEIDSFTNKALETLRLTYNDEELSELKRYLFKWLDSNRDRNLLVQNNDEDDILQRLLKIFEGKVGEPFSEEEIMQIKKEGEARYASKIPPGYKDAKKGEEGNDNNKYGDYIIWKQIIKHASEKAVGIIYVTHDQKEDWWNIVKAKTIGPRIELRKEFVEETSQQFHMYSMNSFISAYNKMNKIKIDNSVFEELINIEKTEQNNKNLKYNKELSKSERIAKTEETITKIEKRIERRKNIIDNIESKYLKKGLELPSNIKDQYDNTNNKIMDLNSMWEKKMNELAMLKRNEQHLEEI